MIIDDQVEPIVRRILGAVVKRDDDKLDTSLKEFPSNGSRMEGLRLAVAISGFVIFDSYEGKPSSEEVGLLAAEIAEMSSWAGLSNEEVRGYLDAILDGTSLDKVMDAETAFMATFIVAGTLLASSDKVGNDEWWFNYLDRVEAAIEATPPQ